MSTEENMERYYAAQHAMQSGVMLKMEIDRKETTPKYLRVGVNSAMVDSGALAGLLIKKGIITEEEYSEVLADYMEKEAEMYRELIQQHYPGSNITLG